MNLLKGDHYEKRLERKLLLLKDDNKNKKQHRPSFSNTNVLQELSEKINKSISDNESLFEILPDIELAMSFLISAILSPKDLLNCELNYTLEHTSLSKESISGVISTIEAYFKKNYNLLSLLPRVLQDALFLTGSYPLLILPETKIDEIINTDCSISKEAYSSTKQSFHKPLGFLSTIKSSNKYLSISDNFNILKKPWLERKLQDEKINEILQNHTVSMEKNKLNTFKRKYTHVPVTVLNTSIEDTIGEPIVIKLASESIIPVYTAGDPTHHVGYFILLDNDGYPINGKRDRQTYEQLQHRLTTDANSELREQIRQTKLAIFGYNTSDYKSNDFNAEIYSKLVEKELLEAIDNGVFEGAVELSNMIEISKIMMARALHKKETTLLFVPEQLVTYIAFDYNKDGIGKSLLENTRILSSLRSVLLFSNVLASIKNSVPRTGVKIDLDETDPNPRETVEFLLNEFTKNHNQAFPIGLTNPADIVDAIQRSSIDVAVSGNTAYPETTLDITDKTRSVAKPDTELENQLRRRHYMAMGLPPEIIDADMNVDFATTVIASNAMVAKKVSIYQYQLCDKLVDFVKKYIFSSQSLIESINKAIGSKASTDKQKEIFNEAINALRISLPAPDQTKIEQQITAFELYSTGLEKMLQAYYSPDLVSRLIPSELEDAIMPTFNCVKSYYQRLWMQHNNIFSELSALTDISDPETKLQMDIIQDDHITALLETVGELMIKIKKSGETVMENAAPPEEEESTEEPTEAESAEEPTEAESTEEPTEESEAPMELPEEESTEEPTEETPEEETGIETPEEPPEEEV